MSTLDRVPAHLRRYVVDQDYAQYTSVDQAVWRFVLLQMADKLQHTAHEAYPRGLRETGISVERIPSLADMDECLNRFGWGAIGVDGFIPPRAFTEFQALGILPICAEIRTADHLVYTPAPDIIHEAAGHAPIVVEPRYADYLRRIGEVGAKAFRVPEDTAVYDAIYTLSELKENPAATPNEIAAAEANFEQAKRHALRISEAARVSRLYWWTAEYGLVGVPDHYKLYGAGLLSSLGESHSCHDASVRKLPLTASCVDVSYDITQPQPQLFVAQDFDHLLAVLDEVSETLAYRRGGHAALEVAHQSEELCTLTLDSGLQLIGQVQALEPNYEHSVSLARLVGPTAFAKGERLLQAADVNERPSELWLVCGSLADGSSLRSLAAGAELLLPLGSELRLTGRLLGVREVAGEPLRVAEDLRLERGGELLAQAQCAELVFADKVLGARAGAADLEYYAATGFSRVTIPRPREFPERERRMMKLYARALDAHANANTHLMVRRFADIHDTLEREYPRDWLLRWNILESLIKRSSHGPLTTELYRELASLERHYEGRQPIASGLRYLGFG